MRKLDGWRIRGRRPRQRGLELGGATDGSTSWACLVSVVGRVPHGETGQNQHRQGCSIGCVCFILSAMSGPRRRTLHDHIPLWNDLGRMEGRLGSRRVENS